MSANQKQVQHSKVTASDPFHHPFQTSIALKEVSEPSSNIHTYEITITMGDVEDEKEDQE